MRTAFFLSFCLSIIGQLPAQVRIEQDVNAELAAQRIQVEVRGTDAEVVSLVRAALAMHGNFSVVTSGSVRVTVDRAGNTARVSCENPAFAFNTEIQGRDVSEISLQAADAAVVGLGRRFNLKPLFASTRIAFLSTFGGGKRDVYAGSLLMNNVRPLTQLRCENLGPRWSADGNRVAFVSYAKGLPDLYIAPYPFGEARPLIAGMRGSLTGGSASPDGSRIAFCSSNQGKTLDLYVSDANGGARRCILRTDDRVESDASWSPDTTQIIFASGSSGSPRLYVIPATGGSPTQLSTGGGYASEPCWNRADRNLICFTQASEGTNSVAVLDLAKGSLTVAAQGTGSVAYSRGAWCADGRHIVVQSQQRGGDRYWLSLADSVTGKITRLTGDQLKSCMQPDCWFPRR